jgi:hypothetical protein
MIIRFISKMLVFVLLGGAGGGLMGMLVAGLVFTMGGEKSGLGMSFGLPMGMVLGGALSCILFPFLRKSALTDVALHLIPPSFVFSMLAGTIPKFGLILTIPSAFLGVFVGLVLLAKHDRSIMKRAVIDSRECEER